MRTAIESLIPTKYISCSFIFNHSVISRLTNTGKSHLKREFSQLLLLGLIHNSSIKPHGRVLKDILSMTMKGY